MVDSKKWIIVIINDEMTVCRTKLGKKWHMINFIISMNHYTSPEQSKTRTWSPVMSDRPWQSHLLFVVVMALLICGCEGDKRMMRKTKHNGLQSLKYWIRFTWLKGSYFSFFTVQCVLSGNDHLGSCYQTESIQQSRNPPVQVWKTCATLYRAMEHFFFQTGNRQR